MSDNELYNYFKVRKNTFDELPGDTLWAGIESGLNNKPAPRKPFPLLIKTGIALIIAGIAGVLMLNKITDREITAPEAIPSIRAIETDEIAAPVFTDTVKKKKKESVDFSSKKNNDNKPAMSIMPGNSAQYKAFGTVKDSLRGQNPQGSDLTETLPDAKTNAQTQIMPGRIVVTCGRMSKIQFDGLVKETLEIHKNAHGSLIIVKAPGQQTFRHKIPALTKPEQATGILYQKKTQKENNSKPKETEYIKFLKVRDTIIEPEQIKFSPLKDSLILPETPSIKHK